MCVQWDRLLLLAFPRVIQLGNLTVVNVTRAIEYRDHKCAPFATVDIILLHQVKQIVCNVESTHILHQAHLPALRAQVDKQALLVRLCALHQRAPVDSPAHLLVGPVECAVVELRTVQHHVLQR